ncbi:AAA ATPase [Arachnomyces sp. PD_36]|nr:AAA ATPase [Arachnomyces sp. PD_36]
MAAKVLGKRQRVVSVEITIPSPKKQRAQEPQIHDDHDEDLSKSSQRYVRSKPTRNNATVGDRSPGNRTKRTVRDNTKSSPAQIKSHFRTTKTISDENAKPTEFKTPEAPRFRDALSNSSTPITPRHRVQVPGKPLTPRTPRTTATPFASQSVYSAARQLFARSAIPGRLVGRETERQEVASFIQNGIDSGNGGCMYISGPPGTGKSALVEEVCQDLEPQKAKVVSINCVSMRSSRDLYGRLVEEFGDGSQSQIFKKSPAEILRDILIPKTHSTEFYVVNLDEIDHLLNSDIEVLYTFFEWSMQKNSHLILIGIANALDLTDRFLPRLKAKNLKPTLLPFFPYTVAQITSVITTRLQSLLPSDHSGPANYVPFVHPAAIQLCSRKVGSQTGDLRKAYELIRHAIDLVETEQQKVNEDVSIPSPTKAPLVENTNLSTNTKEQRKRTLAAFTALTAPRATVAHIAKITSTSMGAGTRQRLQNLNLHQKAAICAIIALDRKCREGSIFNTPSKSPSRGAPTAKRVFDTYVTLCRADNVLPPLSSTEFRDVLSNLETMGLVNEVQGRGGRVTSHNLLHTPSKSKSSSFGSGSPGTPSRMGDERGLACFVTEKEMGEQIENGGVGGEILRKILRGDGL